MSQAELSGWENLDDGQDIRSFPRDLRVKPQRRREKVYIGCGAGFAGDRPLAASKLIRATELNYIVLECLAERTLADRYREKQNGSVGYDQRLSEWFQLLLPLAVERGICIITNMGAVDSYGAQEKVMEIASSLSINVTVAIAHQVSIREEGLDPHFRNNVKDGVFSTYLGAAPIVACLEKYKPNVIITSRVADASLFLAPMIYELGWNWDEYELLAQGSLAGHLLECGCQLTGGYFMHPGDEYRDLSFSCLLDLSLPYAEVSFDGKVCIAKTEGSGGVLNFSTCAEQMLYEVGDPGAYITPDVVIDFRDVTFQTVTSNKILCSGAKPSSILTPEKLLVLAPKNGGWKGWGEISYGGYACTRRAEAADYLVRSWMEEIYPGVADHIFSYAIGLDSLKATNATPGNVFQTNVRDIRLRMDGLFEFEEQAIQLTKEFIALYTNGPAGGGGISTGHKREIILEKGFVKREDVMVHISGKRNYIRNREDWRNALEQNTMKNKIMSIWSTTSKEEKELCSSPAPSGQMIPLYRVAHSRAGDKGNDINFSIIPHFPEDINRLKLIITAQWVKEVLSPLLNKSMFPNLDAINRRDEWVSENVKVEIYEVRGVCSLNVVVRNILDGGVNQSRRIDRHGKTISDLVLSQNVVLLPPP